MKINIICYTESSLTENQYIESDLTILEFTDNAQTAATMLADIMSEYRENNIRGRVDNPTQNTPVKSYTVLVDGYRQTSEDAPKNIRDTIQYITDYATIAAIAHGDAIQSELDTDDAEYDEYQRLKAKFEGAGKSPKGGKGDKGDKGKDPVDEPEDDGYSF